MAGPPKYPTMRVCRRRSAIGSAMVSDRIVIEPNLAQHPLPGRQEAFPVRRRGIIDQVIAGFGQGRPVTSHQHSDHMSPFVARRTQNPSSGPESPSSTEGERSASTVAANPFSRRCCRSAEASSPGRKASTSKISRRSLSSSASGISIAANSSATSPIRVGKRSRMRNRISRCLRAGERGRRRAVLDEPRLAWRSDAAACGRSFAPHVASRNLTFSRYARYCCWTASIGYQRDIFDQSTLQIGPPLSRVQRLGPDFDLPKHIDASGGRSAAPFRNGHVCRSCGSASRDPRPAAGWQSAGCAPAAATAMPGAARAPRRAARRRRRRSTGSVRVRGATTRAAGTRSGRFPATPRPRENQRGAARLRPCSLR